MCTHIYPMIFFLKFSLVKTLCILHGLVFVMKLTLKRVHINILSLFQVSLHILLLGTLYTQVWECHCVGISDPDCTNPFLTVFAY